MMRQASGAAAVCQLRFSSSTNARIAAVVQSSKAASGLPRRPAASSRREAPLAKSERTADRELVARLFALSTAKFEDAAGIAATCQARDSEAADLREALEWLTNLNEEAATLIAAAESLLSASVSR